ncbi:GNAT family N-acetyltransferase [Beijerinckia sp. L45]|uniref:GNAT family N-acetyltransferase n=1 Tax=Beijerinckia sp. L45 TaxID=1641855 RepID=UPI00131E9D8B|nr:GNAT family N-acetyltransferase [Beijerinckia sp. L45]
MIRDKATLTLRQAFFADSVARAAYAALMLDVFDFDVERRDALCGVDPTCRPFAFFDATGACVASVEVFALPLILDGARCDAAAIRSVAVAETWRGRGLFRALMLDALAWCDASLSGPMLLYTEDSSLYERFGFQDVPQHKVVGAAPDIHATTGVRRLSFSSDADATLITHLLAERAPISEHVAVAGGGSLFLTQVAADDAMIVDYVESLDAVVVSKQTRDRLTLIDIVAPTIPRLSSILAVLDRRYSRVETLFPPDKLGWSGRVQRDDTGLMLRGAWPAAFTRPFMLPPTAEF